MSNQSDLAWAVPLMRIGYAGRGLVYTVVAGLSLWTIWQGGAAQGTSEALGQIERSAGGTILLALIALGLFAYMIWRILDAIDDLEEYGNDARGLIARAGQVTTGLIHGALGIGVATIVLKGGDGEEGGGSVIANFTGWIMSQPLGAGLVGAAGLGTIGAAIYYLHKAWSEGYQDHLQASRFTRHWNWALKAGVAAQGIVVGVIGGFLVSAALRADPSEAGGVGQAFSWLSEQVYGQILVTLLCLGLLGFAFFCFVNAVYRIVPKVAGDDLETLAHRLKSSARAVT